MGIFSGSLDCDCCEEEIPEVPLGPLPEKGHTVKRSWTKKDLYLDLLATVAGVDRRPYQYLTPDTTGNFTSKIMPPDGAGRAGSGGSLTGYFTPNRATNWPYKSCTEECGGGTCTILPIPAPFTTNTCSDPNRTITRTSGAVGTFSQYEYHDAGMDWLPGFFGSAFASSESNGGECFLSTTTPQYLASNDSIYSVQGRYGRRIGFEWDQYDFSAIPDEVVTLWDWVIRGLDPTPTQLIMRMRFDWIFGLAIANNNGTGGAHTRTTYYKMYPDSVAAADRADAVVDFEASFGAEAFATDLEFARRLHNPASGALWSHGVTLTLPSGAHATPNAALPGGIDFGTSEQHEVGTETVDIDLAPAYQSTAIRSQVLGLFCGITPAFAPSPCYPGRWLTNIFGDPLNPFGHPPGILGAGGYCSWIRVDATLISQEYGFD